jgi:hypothetical protein
MTAAPEQLHELPNPTLAPPDLDSRLRPPRAMASGRRNPLSAKPEFAEERNGSKSIGLQTRLSGFFLSSATRCWAGGSIRSTLALIRR